MLDKEARKGVCHLIRDPPARVNPDGHDGCWSICGPTIPSRQSEKLRTFTLLALLLLVVSSLVVATSAVVATGIPSTMRHSVILASLAALVSARPQFPWSRDRENSVPLGPDQDGKYTISSEGIRAQFIPYGASLTNLYIKDAQGFERDIVLGYDNATAYAVDASHPHLGGVPGRYANRIKNSTFMVMGQLYKVKPNENNGQDTLHGGPNGWDYRTFNVVAQTSSAITFSITDPDGSEGFPGNVVSYISYAVTPNQWHIRMNATADKWTPLMLSSHVYWNLDGFQNPDTQTALNHTLSLPYSGQRVDVDGILIPTGGLLANQPDSVNDFWSKPKTIGASFSDPAIKDNCGTGCSGYDTCYLVNRDQLLMDDVLPNDGRWWTTDPVASLSSSWSGIQVDVFSDQAAFQIYSCNGQNGSQPLKRTQGFFNDPSRPRVTQQYGCVVMEVEDWIDGINQPSWQRGSKQFIGPGSPPYLLQAGYAFTVKGSGQGRRRPSNYIPGEHRDEIIEDVDFL